MTERTRSTGRRPALTPKEVERLLTRYFDEDKPALVDLAAEFPQVGRDGKTRILSLATMRKYLKSAGIVLPRGRANDLPRAKRSVKGLMNRIPTSVLIGRGRSELLGRKLVAGGGVVALGREFGLSKDRVSRLKRSLVTTVVPEAIKPDEDSSVAGPFEHDVDSKMLVID